MSGGYREEECLFYKMDIMTAEAEKDNFFCRHDHNRIQPGGINASWSNYVKRSVYKNGKN